MVVPEFSTANTNPDSSQVNPYMNCPNLERPSDTAVNIQRSQMPFRNNYRTPCSLSLSPMDSSLPSEGDYAERMAAISNRMDVEMSNPAMDTSSDLIHQPLHVHNEVVPIASSQPDPSTLSVPPSAILYEANVPADSNLWDSHFGPISLFGTNKFLQSDAYNISCSLLQMAQFIRQRNILDCNGNKIP